MFSLQFPIIIYQCGFFFLRKIYKEMASDMTIIEPRQLISLQTEEESSINKK